MTPTHAPPVSLEERIAQVAAGLATERGATPDSSKGYFVRMSPTIDALIDSVKPADLPMPAFLRQCAVQVVLQHLERSQRG
jgi:hypothetical protein